jgi:nitronate monooxygenase
MTSEFMQDLFPAGRLPLIVAPMFLVSGPDLVVACSKSGLVGSFPAANARTVEALEIWLRHMKDLLSGEPSYAPWALNLIVHSTYDRFDRELELVQEYQPKIVTTALGSPKRVLDRVHAYGGLVIADVANLAMARKAVDAGVDALILVSHGAGGHTGLYNPFAFIAEVRKFWPGPLGLAGCISTGSDVRAAQLMGADFAVAGTRFIATEESLAAPAYRDLLVKSDIEDLVASRAVSGVMGNWLKSTMVAAGINVDETVTAGDIDFSGNISARKKAWKEVWSAGQGVGTIDRIVPVGTAAAALRSEYLAVLKAERDYISQTLTKWNAS